MAKIDWTPRFLTLLANYIDEARLEFGKFTASRWADEVAVFEHRLMSYPMSYSPESLLVGRRILYRSCHIMNHRFKIIYYYDESENTVHVIDIWDTRMNPQALIKRIK